MVDDQKQDAPGRRNGEGMAYEAGATRSGAKTEKSRKAESLKVGEGVKQIGAIFDKGLGVVDATLDLGLTVLNRVGGFALERMNEASGLHTAGPNAAHAAQPDQAPGVEPTAPQGPVPEEQGYCITNRLPVTLDGKVKVPFSINNDSMVARKTVSLRLEGFVGETEGQRILSDHFTIKPAKKAIAACDFARFELLGSISPEVPPDIYMGSVVVESGSGESMSIPVRLVIG